jgi:hypothetical protein
MSQANPVEVERYLKGINYPAQKNELVKHARQQGAEQEVLETINHLPNNQTFQSPIEVNQAIGAIKRQ